MVEHDDTRRDYFLGATVACGQLQQTGAYLINCGYDHMVTFPTWRTSGEVAPVDSEQEMVPAEGAAGTASVEVAAGADLANNQDPEADGGLNDGLAPTDPVAPPMSVGRRQPNEPTEAERLAHNRTHIPFADWCESCVRGRGRDDPHRARQDHVEGNTNTNRSMRLFLLQSRGGGHLVQGNQRDRFGIQPHDGSVNSKV